MARQPNLDPIRAMIRSIGEQIGQELRASMLEAATQAEPTRPARPVKAKGNKGATARKPGRPAMTKRGCTVPGCKRNSAAKGVCGTHYAKAKRLGMNLDTLSRPQLKELGQDGRATRWQK